MKKYEYVKESKMSDYTLLEGDKGYKVTFHDDHFSLRDNLSFRLPIQIIAYVCSFLGSRPALLILPYVSRKFEQASSDDVVWHCRLNKFRPEEGKTTKAKEIFKEFPSCRTSTYTLVGRNGFRYYAEKMDSEMEEKIKELKNEDEERKNNANFSLIEVLSHSEVRTLIRFRVISLESVCKFKPLELRNLRNNTLIKKNISPLLENLKVKPYDLELRNNIRSEISKLLEYDKKNSTRTLSEIFSYRYG